MRDYSVELEKRADYIKETLKKANAKGVVFGNSGGKDCALVGILCKKATENVLGVAMPCESKQNYEQDMTDALKLAELFEIENIVVDLTDAKTIINDRIKSLIEVAKQANSNIAPRLRMTALYTIAQSLGYLVAGTGNLSEITMGYFTKWGDGAYDFNPISDLTVTEVYEFLNFLNAPESIIAKKPSAGLFEGQTDEEEMGLAYSDIDKYILVQNTPEAVSKKIQKANQLSEHKRKLPSTFINP